MSVVRATHSHTGLALWGFNGAVDGAAEPFGTLLRTMRQNAGLTQEQLAARANLSTNAISALERGERRRPYRHTLSALARALDLTSAERAALEGSVPVRAGPRPPDAVPGHPADPTYATARRSRRRPAAPVPRQLPAVTRMFTGREADLARLDALLHAGDIRTGTVPIAVIDGPPGVGKTTLAVAWAHSARSAFPDGQLYANLRGYDPEPPARPEEVLEAFLRALGTGFDLPPTAPEQAALFRSLVHDRRLLIVLDNAASAEQVRPLLPGSPSCLVVVTSRSSLAGLVTEYGATRVDLDVLAPGEATLLLRAVIGEPRATAEPAALVRLADLCSRLPLALHLAGQRAAAHREAPLTDLAVELLDETHRLDLLSIGVDGSTALRPVFQWSYRNLPSGHARMFRLLGLHPGVDISGPAAAALTGLAPPAARRMLDGLADARLVERTDRDRFRLHDLLRLYAREHALTEDGTVGQAAATGRLVEFYLHTAAVAELVLHPGRRAGRVDDIPRPAHPVAFDGYDDALAWCERERANLVAVIRLAAEAGPLPAAWQLPDRLWSYFYVTKHWTDWLTACRTGLAAARRAGDLIGQARLLRGLATIHRDRHEFDAAIDRHRESLALYRELGDAEGEAMCLSNLGDAYLGLGRYGEALHHSRDALSMIRRIGNRYQEGIALGNVAEACLGLGRYAEALDHFVRVRELCREIEHRHGEATTLIHLGESYLGLGRDDDATERLTEAVELCRQLRDQHGEGVALGHLGAIHVRNGRLESGRRYLHMALSLLDHLGDPHADAVRAQLARCPSGQR